jgi:hypothetical protein
MPKTYKCNFCGAEFRPKRIKKSTKYCSHDCYGKSLIGVTGEKTPQWKDEDKLSYAGIHKWISRTYGNAIRCEFCNKKTGKFEWANISGQYLRDSNDWIQLCHKCHNLWDGNIRKASRTRKRMIYNFYAIDFDSVLCQREGIPTNGDFRNCYPVEGALAAVNFLFKLGHECYVFTSRQTKEHKDIVLWLYKWGFPGMMVSNTKKKGITLWVDDRGYRFTNWKDIIKLIK